MLVPAAKNLDFACKDATLKAGKAHAFKVKIGFDVAAENTLCDLRRAMRPRARKKIAHRFRGNPAQ